MGKNTEKDQIENEDHMEGRRKSLVTKELATHTMREESQGGAREAHGGASEWQIFRIFRVLSDNKTKPVSFLYFKVYSKVYFSHLCTSQFTAFVFVL